MRACAGLLLLAGLALPAWTEDARGWLLSGRAGVEYDALGERFGSGSLFDPYQGASITPGGGTDPIEDALEVIRFRDTSSQTSLLLETLASRPGTAWVQSRALLRLGRTRTRGHLEIGAGRDGARTGWSGSDRLGFEGGPEGGGTGLQNQLNVSWDARRLPLDLRLELRGGVEHSWSSRDSLESLFNYQVYRPAFGLRRPLGGAGDLDLRAGFNAKRTADAFFGEYAERWWETEWSQFRGLGRTLRLRARHDLRRYADGDTLAPSHEEVMIEADVEVAWPWVLHTRLAPRWQTVAYSADTEIYRDHWLAEGTLEFGLSLRDLRGDPPADPLSGILASLEPDWRLGAGGRLSVLRNQSVTESDYLARSFFVALAREGSERFWLDLTCEVGRRAYRVPGGTGNLVLEGFHFSLTGTDYTFVSTSLLAQITLWKGARLELFGMLDEELHEAAEDDISLWSLNASLTRGF